MVPRLGPVPTHDVFVLLGVLVATVVLVLEARRRGHTDERLYVVVTCGLVGGALLMRLGTWMQHLDPGENASLAVQWASGNRSVIGGLLGAWLGVHVGKRVSGYRLRTGDLFAPAVALGMAVGRVGCLLTEAPGTPTGSGWGIRLDPATAARLGVPPDVPLHPSFAYEIAFHLVVFGLIWGWLRYRPLPPGELFVWWVAAYGVFRFLVESVRGNEVAWAGLTRPQLVLAVTVPLVLLRIAVHARRGDYAGVRGGPAPVRVASEVGA